MQSVAIRLRTVPLFLYVAFFMLFMMPMLAHAQMGSALMQSSDIALTPRIPLPETEFTARLDAYSIDTTGASIAWFVDGVEVVRARNARSVTLKSPSLGDSMRVSVTVQPVGGPSFTLRKEIAPTAIDVVVEAETYVPSFYRGRALPSGDAHVRVVAIPHVGSNADPRSFTYLWEQNGGVLGGGAIRGKQSIDLIVPRYTGGTVRVSVTDASGEQVGEGFISLEAMRPEVQFYEENPLRGLSEQAITNSLVLVGEETTVHGEPYFMSMESAREKTTFEWSINGTQVDARSHDGRIITLRREGGGGQANVFLSAVYGTQVPQFAESGFTVTY